jgi:hypothetical protein
MTERTVAGQDDDRNEVVISANVAALYSDYGRKWASCDRGIVEDRCLLQTAKVPRVALSKKKNRRRTIVVSTDAERNVVNNADTMIIGGLQQ